MDYNNVYNNISERTNGEIYIGVVGPVRTGKSTFIKRFMDMLVIPNISDSLSKEQAKDELPQSSAGKTIMTTEPKFIPKNAVKISLRDDIQMKVRMIDCVGYMAEGASGHLEEDKERMVHTPWFDYEIPFTKAAEIGTKKVITDHSTIGIIITTDGSFGELPRSAYLAPEQKTVNELKALNKPFIVLLNTTAPKSLETQSLVKQMEQDYSVSVLPVNCEQLKKEDIEHILEAVVLEFPIDTITFQMPKWVETLEETHWVKENVIAAGREILNSVNTMKDLYNITFPNMEAIDNIELHHIDLANGQVHLQMSFNDKYYYEMISQLIDSPIENEYHFMQVLKELANKKKEYEKVAAAMDMVTQKGYGVVTPEQENITVEPPELITGAFRAFNQGKYYNRNCSCYWHTRAGTGTA